MLQRIATVGCVVLCGAGVTLLWPESAAAAAAWPVELEHADVPATELTVEAAPPVAPAFLRVAVDSARERADVLVLGPAESVRRVAGPLGDAFGQPLRFAACADIDALRAVVSGAADAAVISEAFERQLPDPALRECTLGTYVVAFVRHPDNPVHELSRAQVDEICRGRARGWSDVGGRGGEFALSSVFSGPGEEARALGGAQGLTRARERGLSVDEVLDRVARNRNALGLIAARELPAHASYVAIDGVAPGAHVAATGSYPFVYRLRLVHHAEPRAPMQAFLRFLLGGDGQRVLREM